MFGRMSEAGALKPHRDALRILSYLLVIVVVFGVGAAQAQTRQTSRGRSRPAQDFDRTKLQPDIIFQVPDKRPIHGVRCATPPVSPLEAELIEAGLRAWRARQTDFMPRQVSIPVAFHVITDGGSGDVSDAQIDSQISVLNDALASSGFSFSLDSVDRTDNTSWYNGCGSDAMSDALAVDTSTTLNIYTCDPVVLGYAYLPGAPDGYTRDGVYLLHSTLPGGSAAPYNEGDTATHEVGHYLGLYHTFRGGCSEGDEVADTPAEASAATGCPTGRDSCAELDGLDPINNFMDYTDDACVDRFSPGQSTRMSDMVAAYRPNLGNVGGGGGGSVPSTPSPVSPSGTIDTDSPTFTWNEASGDNVSQYELLVTQTLVGTAYNATQGLDICSGGSCSVTPATLTDDYYSWEVRAENDVGWSDWSSPTSFTVDTRIAQPTAPVLNSPSGEIHTNLPTFRWNVTVPEITAYQLRVQSDTGTDVHNEIYGTSICDSSSCSATVTSELDDGDYTWVVAAQNEAGWSGWSSIASFTVALESATTPAAPHRLSPSGTIGDNRPAFRWNVPSGAPSLYQLRVQRSDGATAHDDAYAPGICDSSSCSTTLSSALDNGEYTWQARAQNDIG